ncbi:hypothetical protein KFE25_010194 [Diacronema lutheri]|uniref:Ubiquitin-like protease family profile domain-containing protein n=2 Tax=Diacronema lutheri TaxID=2081491 RepID=A0A8J6CB72_DIALT|nr:hypothetical protein KFE25_010194 [Diacronema lutheri]
MLAGLLRINLPDVSGLRDFLRPGRGAKRPLEGASSSQPAPAKRASTAEPRALPMTDHRARLPLAHMNGAPRVPPAPRATEPRARVAIATPPASGAGGLSARARTPSALGLVRMSEDSARFAHAAGRQPFAPAYSARAQGRTTGSGLSDAPAQSSSPLVGGVARDGDGARAAPSGSPARRLDAAFDGAAARAPTRPFALYHALAMPTRLPSPPPSGVAPRSLGGAAASEAVARAGRAWQQPAPPPAPADAPAPAWRPSLCGRPPTSLPFRELVALCVREEAATAQRSLLGRLSAERARAEDARAARVDARIKLTADVLALGVILAERDSALERAEADVQPLAADAADAEGAARALCERLDALDARLGDDEADTPAEHHPPLAPVDAFAAAAARVERGNEAIADARGAQAALPGTRLAAERARDGLAQLSERVCALAWAAGSDAEEIALLKLPALAARASAVHTRIGDACRAAERALELLARAAERLSASLAPRAEARERAAAAALAAAAAAMPARHPAGTRMTALVPLSPAENDRVDELLRAHGSPHEQVVNFEKQSVMRKDLWTLRPAAWLNDEVINLYLKLVLARAQRDGTSVRLPTAPLRAHVFQTFFLNKLLGRGYDYSAVRRWTKNVDLFALDAVIVPVNERQTHWVLAVINMRSKRFEFFDSLGGTGDDVLEHLRRYVRDEHMAKKGSAIDLSGWEAVSWSSAQIPMQNNGSDCGVFMCQFASTVVRNVAINFTCADMPHIRRRMVIEIVRAELLDDESA